MTVYRFSKDQAWPKPVSACTGSCLEKWPAVAPVDENDVKATYDRGILEISVGLRKKEKERGKRIPIERAS